MPPALPGFRLRRPLEPVRRQPRGIPNRLRTVSARLIDCVNALFLRKTLSADFQRRPGAAKVLSGEGFGSRTNTVQGIPYGSYDSQIRSALPADSRYRLSDCEHGLYVCVHPHGGPNSAWKRTPRKP